MKIDYSKRRRPAEMEGYKLSAAEEKTARELARLFATLDFDTCAALRDGLAAGILARENDDNNSEPGTEDDRRARDRLERTVILYRAAYMACHRIDLPPVD